MKKIYLAISIFILFLVIFPFIGNNIIERVLEKKISDISSQNLIVKKSNTKFSYFSTQKEYQFLYKESNQEILIGADIRYSNLLFNKMVSVEIYPIFFGQKQIEAKTLLVHIDYNIITQNFNGYFKDIKQIYTLKDATKISLSVLNSTFNGKGKLNNPNTFNSNMEQFSLKIIKKSQIVSLDIQDFISSITHNEEDKKEMTTEISCHNLYLNSDRKKVQFEDFNYSTTFNELDKKVFINFQKRVQENPNEIRTALLELLSNSRKISINNLSFKNIVINNKNLGALKLSSNLIFRKNFLTDTNLQISKKIFKEIQKSFPLIYLVQFYAQNVGDDYFFNIKLKDEKLTVNGKGLNL